jgi:hypothetical protein
LGSKNETGTNGVKDRATRWRAVAAIGALLLSSLLGGCGESGSPEGAPADGAPAQLSIEEEIAAIQTATPNPITPEVVAETFALGTNATDIQREIVKKALIGSVVEWDLVVYEVAYSDGRYELTSQPIRVEYQDAVQLVHVRAYLHSQGPEDDAYLRSVKTDEPIRIRGLVQDVVLRTMVKIGPGVVVGAGDSLPKT